MKNKLAKAVKKMKEAGVPPEMMGKGGMPKEDYVAEGNEPDTAMNTSANGLRKQMETLNNQISVEKDPAKRKKLHEQLMKAADAYHSLEKPEGE